MLQCIEHSESGVAFESRSSTKLKVVQVSSELRVPLSEGALGK